MTFIARFRGQRGPALKDLRWERPAAQPPSLLRAPWPAPLPCPGRVWSLKRPVGLRLDPEALGALQGPGSTRWV